MPSRSPSAPTIRIFTASNRILADGQHDEAGNEEGDGDVDERDQGDVGPARQGLTGALMPRAR